MRMRRRGEEQEEGKEWMVRAERGISNMDFLGFVKVCAQQIPLCPVCLKTVSRQLEWDAGVR